MYYPLTTPKPCIFFIIVVGVLLSFLYQFSLLTIEETTPSLTVTTLYKLPKSDKYISKDGLLSQRWEPFFFFFS